MLLHLLQWKNIYKWPILLSLEEDFEDVCSGMLLKVF